MINPLPNFAEMSVEDAAQWIFPLFEKHGVRPIRKRADACALYITYTEFPEFQGPVHFGFGVVNGFDGESNRSKSHAKPFRPAYEHGYAIGRRVAELCFGTEEKKDE